MLAGKGYDNVFNLSGGIKSWNANVAFHSEEKGLELFAVGESPEETLRVAYSLEEGLRDFYLTMASQVENNEARKLFEKLSEIEIKHQNRIYKEYTRITLEPVSRDAFHESVTTEAMEGGLTTEEYAGAFDIDWESVEDIIGLAMSIEAQAMDLYQRASDRSDNSESQAVLIQIADEERNHLTQLGKLMERI